MQLKSPLRDLNLVEAKDVVVDFIERNSDKGYVMGLSGGLDSSVTLALAKEAVGDKVKVLIMPDPEVTPEEDVEDALLYVKNLGVEYKIIDISPIVKAYSELLPYDTLALGNLRARIRMSLLYYYANLEGRKVLGAGDKSEILIGYFTKYGDGGVDLLPIGCLYKTELRVLAPFIGVPEKIAKKKSSPRLWKEHLAEEELGLSYDVIDKILVEIFEKGKKVDEVKKELKLSWEVDRVWEMHVNSAHKRATPPIPKL